MKFVIGFVALFAILLVGCSQSSQADQKDAKITSDQQGTYSQFQPLHVYDYSQVRDSLIQIYDFLVQPQATWTVATSDLGSVLFTCESFGYPLAADTQLTNPLRREARGEGVVVLEQSEPTGIFSSKNTYGTYVLCVRASGQIVPVYTEGNVTAYPFEVTVIDGIAVDAGGPSSIEIVPGASNETGTAPATP